MGYTYIYDGAVILILAAGMVSGYIRGAVKTVLAIAFTIISIGAASYFSSERYCEMIYDEYLHDRIVTSCKNAVDEAISAAKDDIKRRAKEGVGSFDDHGNDTIRGIRDAIGTFIEDHSTEIDDTISAVAKAIDPDIGKIISNEEVSRYIDEAAEVYSYSAVDRINSRLPLGITIERNDIKEIAKDKTLIELFICDMLGLDGKKTGYFDTVDYIERKMIRPTALSTLHGIIWIAVFTVLKILMSVVFAVITAIKKNLPILNTADKLIGMALGAVGGAVLIGVCTFIISKVIFVTGGTEHINETVINSTIIYRYIYSILIQQ